MDSMVWPGVSRTWRRRPGKSSVSPSCIGYEGVFRLGAGAEMDRRAATVAQFQMAGYEVGVEVGQEDVADLEAEFLGVGQVLLDVALGIDDDGGRTGLVSKQIRRVGEAAQVVLFQNHVFSIGLPRPSGAIHRSFLFVSPVRKMRSANPSPRVGCLSAHTHMRPHAARSHVWLHRHSRKLEQSSPPDPLP